MEITLIWAMDPLGGIGWKNRLPWDFPEDLRHFRELTLHHPVVMGRKTYESLPSGPLPERRNIVMSRSECGVSQGKGESVLWFHSVQEVIDWAGKEEPPRIFVIGGRQIYGEFLPLADKLEVTRIKRIHRCDCFFPEVDWEEWEKSSSEERDEFAFETYVRTARTR